MLDMLHNQMLVDSSEIVFDNLDYSTEVLVEDSTNERKRRMSESKESENKKKDSNNKLLVRYPFGVDEAVLKKAASGLKELGGDFLGIECVEDTKPRSASAMQGVQSHVSSGKGKSTRTHYVSILEDDVDRLRPGQFLSDTLVDFWMRW